MLTAFPNMTHAERLARATAKRQLLIQFLASGEVYTTTVIASQVMSCSRSAAERTLSSLVLAGSLKTESHLIDSRKSFIYGITPHGLALADQFDKPFFELGRTNSSYIKHHLQTQMARLSAEAAGWTGWVPGKVLHGKNYKKIPDALVTRPDTRHVAIEIERFIKTPKRYEEVISAHLQSITKGYWHEVHYLMPSQLNNALKKAFERVETVPVQGERLKLEQKHRDRFHFFNFEQWPPLS